MPRSTQARSLIAAVAATLGLVAAGFPARASLPAAPTSPATLMSATPATSAPATHRAIFDDTQAATATPATPALNTTAPPADS
ncbi:hypothetical protein [Streptomyces sp. NPDC088725]|uniref:hypothetical protein n=1 Tax=Streptomyces sp. NPDC088725 TaxID=3365873 RepID=UPI00381F9DFB